MAAFNPQFKINQLAKDMGLKTKDLSELLTAKGMDDVKPQKSLTEKEFDILMQTITTDNQIDNIYDYMDGITYIPSKVAEEKAAAAREAEAEAKAKAEAEAKAKAEAENK